MPVGISTFGHPMMQPRLLMVETAGVKLRHLDVASRRAFWSAVDELLAWAEGGEDVAFARLDPSTIVCFGRRCSVAIGFDGVEEALVVQDFDLASGPLRDPCDLPELCFLKHPIVTYTTASRGDMSQQLNGWRPEMRNRVAAMIDQLFSQPERYKARRLLDGRLELWASSAGLRLLVACNDDRVVRVERVHVLVTIPETGSG